jgi:integrase
MWGESAGITLYRRSQTHFHPGFLVYFCREAGFPARMLTEEHDDGDGRRVWLDESEVEQLLSITEEQKHRIALALGVRGGLRSHEIVQVAPEHVINTDAGTMLTVPEGKGDKYRETPIPETLAASIRSIGEYRDDPADAPVVTNPTRTLRYWMQKYREEMAEYTDDDRWHFLTTHDLRRTWAGQLANADVDETVALRWGGWNDLETFLDHYRGEATAAAQKRERGKVVWL